MNSETSSKMSGDEVESLRFADRYALECIVSRGLGSVVWRARDERHGGAVALKFFPAEFVATTSDLIALQQVIAAARRLDLPNVAATHAIELHQGHAALVRPWIDGRSLDELRLTRDTRYFDVEVIAPWVGSLAEALARLHSHHLIHGALQPGKLIIDSAGDLRVIDVGVSAWLLGAMEHHGGKVESSGSLPYFSPGRRVGDAMAPADDIYAFGAIVHELLTGKPPRISFRGRMARSRKLGSAPIPEEWEAVVQECLVSDPSRRIQNFEQILERLAPWLSNQQSLRSQVSHAHGSPGPPGIGEKFQPSPVRGPPLEAESATLRPEPADSTPDAGARFLRTLSALTLAAVIAIGGWLAFHFVRVAPRDEPADIASRSEPAPRSATSPLFADETVNGGELPGDRGEEPLPGNGTTAESGAEALTTSDEMSDISIWNSEPHSVDPLLDSLSSDIATAVAPVDNEVQTAAAESRDDSSAISATAATPEAREILSVAESDGVAIRPEAVESTDTQEGIEAATTEPDIEEPAVGSVESKEAANQPAAIDADLLEPLALAELRPIEEVPDDAPSSETERTTASFDEETHSTPAASRIDPWESMEVDVPAQNPEFTELPSVIEPGAVATPPEIAAELEVADEPVTAAEPGNIALTTSESGVEERSADEPDTVLIQPPVTITDDAAWTERADLPLADAVPDASPLPQPDDADSSVEAEPRTTGTVLPKGFPEGIELEALGLEPPVVPPLAKTPNTRRVSSVTASGVEAAKSVAGDKEVAAVDKSRRASSEVKISSSNDEGGEPPLDIEASAENSMVPPGSETVRVVAPSPEHAQMESTVQESSPTTTPDEEIVTAGPEPTTEVVEAPTPSVSSTSAEPPIDYDQIFGLDSVDAYPELLEQTSPDIPRRLQRTARDARIEVEVVIDRMGRISSAVVREASNRRLIEPSLNAVRSWRFRPARKDGRPVAVRTVLPLVFANGG